jgi:hypothetical protein
MPIDLDDLDTYDTDALRDHAHVPAVAAELARRDAAESARRRCDQCWHEKGCHHPLCSNLVGGTPCECCSDDDGERPVAGSSIARESRNWVDGLMQGCGLVRS